MGIEPKTILVVGCQRSGTTLLASMLGGHSEINMLFESTTDEVFRMIGKQYNGNKLLAYRQIRMRQRASRFGHLINRMANLHFRGKKHQRCRVFPTSQLSIEDYLAQGARLITIVREKEEVISSILSRTEMTRKQALKEYEEAMALIDEVKQRSHLIDFYDLVHRPEQTLTLVCEYLGLKYEDRMLEGTVHNTVYPDLDLNKDRARNPYGK